MEVAPGQVHLSVSTWQQPTRGAASPEREAVLRHVADRVVACGPRRVRVAIDGLTAAGKTSFGHELAEGLAAAGRPVLRASLDDFKKPWGERHLYDRESGTGYYRNAYDYPTLVRLLLEPASPDGSGACALCSIDPLTQSDHSAVVARAPANAVLIVDGVFAFRPQINNYWDVRVWLAVAEDLSVRRGTTRDQSWAGAQAETLHRDRYLAAERLYIAEVDPVARADFVIDNTSFDRPQIVGGRCLAEPTPTARATPP